jgi:Fe-S cluster biogenesis protein NfuA
MEERFDAVMEALAEIRPYLIAAGGDAKLAGLEEKVVSVVLAGSFTSYCRSKREILESVEETVKSRLPWVERVIAVCPSDGREAQ